MSDSVDVANCTTTSLLRRIYPWHPNAPEYVISGVCLGHGYGRCNAFASSKGAIVCSVVVYAPVSKFPSKPAMLEWQMVDLHAGGQV